jgi:glycosyltransferase involved in cell wall biosynthesis
MITDSGVSSAGAFRGLLHTFLSQGHEIDFYGYRRFTEPKSLESMPGYRFRGFMIEWNHRIRPWVLGIPSPYPEVLRSMVAHVAFQRQAIRNIEASKIPYDFVLCLDVPNLFKSTRPVLSWPQGPPHTEWQALRKPDIARSMIKGAGWLHYATVQGFYASRWVQAKIALDASDLFLVGSPWAVDRWVSFGVAEDRVKLAPYPVELSGLSTVPPPKGTAESATFLWLGRSVPRKRLDLFIQAFELVRRRRPGARARFVGAVDADAAARTMLKRFEGDPTFSVTGSVPRSEVPALFESTDVLVQPRESENFGFSIAEALGAGRPIVAGPTNGTAAFGGDALFSFPTYDPEAVAAAMERAWDAVAENPVALAEAARSAARASFEPERVAANVLEQARLAIDLHRGCGGGARKRRG